MNIVITLCTRQRPVMLRQCLHSLVGQVLSEGASFSVVVVENNETDACRSIVEDIASQPGAPRILYAHEPRLGISTARNRALDLALKHCPDWIGFIDDDEIADPYWISHFVTAIRTIEADVLHGPVEYFDARTGAVTKTRWRYPTGHQLKTAPTGNTLMRARLAHAEGWGFRFNESMGFTGGEDTDFFARAVDRGAVIRWVDDAVVRESVPPERLTLRWKLHRARQTAANNTNSYMLRKGHMKAVARYIPKCLRRLARATFEFPVGLLVYPFSPKRGAYITERAACKIWWVAGSLGAVLHIKPESYRTIEGY